MGQFEVRGDRDTFRVRFEAGKTYQINASGSALTLQLPDGTAFMPPLYYSNNISFVAPVTGDYWVTAADYGQSSFYTITATELVDTTPASLATTLTLGVGETALVVRSADNGGDDWYAMDLVAGQSYFLKSSGLADDLYLIGSDGAVVTIQDHQLHFTATQTGKYYAGIRVFGGGGGTTLSLEAVADDYGETAASAGTLAVDAIASGVWETGTDSDWFAVTLTAGNSYRFALSVANGPSQNTKIYDAAGNLVGGSVLGDADGATIFAPGATGTYYVSASAGPDFYNPNGNWSYSLSATQLVGDLTNNVLTTGTLAIDVPKVGSWQGSGDADWFAVTLGAGQSYRFAITGGFSPSTMVLYDSAGNEVSRALINPATALVQTAATAGTYYLGVGVTHGTGNYTITATTFTDDFANNSTTTGKLDVGGAAIGRFEADMDADWFAVQLEAGKSYSLAVDGIGGAGIIRDAQGNMLTPTSISNGDRYFSPSVTGTYYLEAVGNIGDYTASIAAVNDDFRADLLTRGVIRTSVSGNDTDEVLSSGEGYEAVYGLGGNDRFVASSDYDWFVGGPGIDTVDFGQFAVGVNVSLRTGGLYENGALRLMVTQTENVEGSAHGDVIEGALTANALYGKDGNDTLTGLGGNDTIDGGAGIDRAVFTGNRADYRVVMEGQGYRVTDLRAGANDGIDLVSNVEILVFADREVAVPPPPGTDTDFRFVTVTGFTGGVSGYGTIFGTNGFQDITVLDGPTSIVFDGSFARGGDVLRLHGNAADYNASIAGSNVLLTAENFAITVPIGTAGLPIVFADGVRTLVYDASLGSVRIGAQAFSEAAQITAAPDGTVLPGGGDPSVSGRVVLSSDISAPVAATGKIDVFGTNGSDQITLKEGLFVLDSSFSRGGDTIHLLHPASGFKAYISGSSVVLTSSDTTLTIPIGLVATTLDFAGTSLGLRYDEAMGAVRIGNQSITATTLETADPLTASALALAAESFA